MVISIFNKAIVIVNHISVLSPSARNEIYRLKKVCKAICNCSAIIVIRVIMTCKRQYLCYQVNIYRQYISSQYKSKRELNIGFLFYQDRDEEREL